jgi:hypothetical protein
MEIRIQGGGDFLVPESPGGIAGAVRGGGDDPMVQ